ncbi:MAG TPA: helix-turn-helix transcriptional regulator [Acholeplasmataceae bacterium]|nr:helix-turn-helix transcriptional regulator [Acholeplasmataceae bacterium]
MKTLAELRKEKNMTQKELAKALKLSVSAISMYEIGERTPSLKKAIKIADLFGVPIESIDFFSRKRS